MQIDRDILHQCCPSVCSMLILCLSGVDIVYYTSADTHFQGNPFSGDAKYKGVGKFCDFRLKSPSVSEMVQDRPMVAMER